MIKVVAVSITMGGRMGGGVFSPSLMVGALLGLSYGIIATSIVPQCQGQFPFMRLRAWRQLPPQYWVHQFPPH